MFLRLLPGLMIILSAGLCLSAEETGPPPSTGTAPSSGPSTGIHSDSEPAGETAEVPEETSAAELPPGKPPGLIIDYLPNFIYHDEQVTAVLRVSNPTGTDVQGVLRIDAGIGGAKALELRTNSYQLAPGTEKQFTLNLDIEVFKKEVKTLLISLISEKGEALATVPIRLVRMSEPLPVFKLTEGLRFTLKDNHRLIFVLLHRVYQEQRKWLIPRWVKNNVITPKEYNTFLLMAAPLSGDKSSYLDDLAKDIGGLERLDLIDFPAAGAYPALANAALAAPKIKGRVRDRAVIFMPYSDILLGTGKREYRMACEFLIQRLEKTGYENLLLVAPAVPRPLVSRYEPYMRELSELARIYHLPLKKPEGLDEPALWSADGRSSDILGRYPNKEGRKAIAEYLKNAIR